MIDNKKDEPIDEVRPAVGEAVPKTTWENGQLDAGEQFASFDALKEVCEDNAKFYESDDNECGQRYHGALTGIIDHIEVARKLATEVLAFAHEFDFDERTPGNGYRSFVKCTRLCVEHSLRVAKHIAVNRTFIWFRKNMYMKEIESCSQLLASLCSCLEQILAIHVTSEKGSLFPLGEYKAEGLFATSDSVNQYCFYGRCLGFHYCDSMQSVLKFLGICLAGFSEAYYRSGGVITKATSSMWTGGKYYWNPELRARRIVNLSHYSAIDFCKAFWSLTENELMYTLPNVFGTRVKVNKLITIPPEPLQVPSASRSDTLIDVPVPSSHLGPGPVTARLLSSTRREGMFGERKKRHVKPPATGLIFHCHGGGFVAQSSKSHEIYLREWAVALDVPIISIDYSLAPEAPYPRALEEVFYAYCWVLKNCNLLGTTAQRIIVVGDSAGANLNLALILKCIDLNVRRPDGALIIYCPVKISFDPTPARYLCLMDPLLPFGFLMRCLKAYADPTNIRETGDKEKLNDPDATANGNNNSSLSTTNSAVMVNMSGSESDMPTFVHIGGSDLEATSEKNGDNSMSLDDSSVWEHIDNVPEMDADNKSLGSDDSDTFASASLQNSASGGGNTDMMTPDESIGESFEEDSQPLTLQKPSLAAAAAPTEGGPAARPGGHLRTASAASVLLEMDSPEHKNESVKYVADFVDRYVMNTDANGERPELVSVPRTKSEENILLDESRDAINVQNIPTKIYRAVETAANTVANTFNAITAHAPISDKYGSVSDDDLSFVRNLGAVAEKNPRDEFQFEIVRDPFMSPYYASDEVMRQMPRMKILSVDMDPCLDDCIMLAKRLKALGKSVSLDILEGLPHGFLSFVKLSKEANEGNRVCIARISELLEADVPAEESTC